MIRLLILLGLLSPGASLAEILPRLTVRAMCAEADAIVLGTVKDGDLATIERWFKVPNGETNSAKTIFISKLAAYSRETEFGKSTHSNFAPKVVSGDRFVAFLKRTSEGHLPLDTLQIGDTTGSCGLIWIDQGKCWAYPGSSWGYGLYPFNDIESKDYYVATTVTDNPGTEKALIEELKIGIWEAKLWTKFLAEPNLEQRAELLSKYYLASTSPVGAQTTYVGQLFKHILPLESAAVPALVRSLNAIKPGDDSSSLLRTLSELNADIRSVTPALIRLLRRPDLANPREVLFALQNTQDPLMLPFLPPLLLHPNSHVREEAEKALRSISFATLQPGQLAADAPMVAIIAIPDKRSEFKEGKAAVRALKFRNIKGELPGEFQLEDVAFGNLPSGEFLLAFLQKDEHGRIIPTSRESLKKYRRGVELVLWSTHWIPLEEVLNAVHPKEKAVPRDSVLEYRQRLRNRYLE